MPADLDLRRTLPAIWNGTRNPPAGGARDMTARILSRRNKPVGSQQSPSQARGGGPPEHACCSNASIAFGRCPAGPEPPAMPR